MGSLPHHVRRASSTTTQEMCCVPPAVSDDQVPVPLVRRRSFRSKGLPESREHRHSRKQHEELQAGSCPPTATDLVGDAEDVEAEMRLCHPSASLPDRCNPSSRELPEEEEGQEEGEEGQEEAHTKVAACDTAQVLASLLQGGKSSKRGQQPRTRTTVKREAEINSSQLSRSPSNKSIASGETHLLRQSSMMRIQEACDRGLREALEISLEADRKRIETNAKGKCS